MTSPGVEVVPADVDPAEAPQPGYPYVQVTEGDLNTAGPMGWLRLLARETQEGHNCVVGHFTNIQVLDEGADAIRFRCRTQPTGHKPSGVQLEGIVDRKGYTIFSTTG